MDFNIFYYWKYFEEKELSSAKSIIANKQVSLFSYSNNGNVSACVNDLLEYNVKFSVSDYGVVNNISCDCYRRNSMCNHVAAVAMLAKDEYNRRLENSDKGSPSVDVIIYRYTETAKSDAELLSENNPVHIIPEITLGIKIKYSLTIGRDKRYRIKDINALNRRFVEQSEYPYGKNFTFKHRLDAIDEKSRSLLDFTTLIYASDNYHMSNISRSTYEFVLNSMMVDKFFEIYRNDNVIIDNKEYRVVYEDPKISFTIKGISNSRFRIENDGMFTSDKALIPPYAAFLRLSKSLPSRTILDFTTLNLKMISISCIL